MRFSALLFLAALAGALVCAQDASSDTTEAAPGPVPTEATKSPAESASPQETTQSIEGLNALKSLVSKGRLKAEYRFRKAGKRLNERFQDGKRLYENGAEFVQNLKAFSPDFLRF